MTDQAGISGKLYELDKRLLQSGGHWFARTREIPSLGPFHSRQEAIDALYRHVERWQSPERLTVMDAFRSAQVHRVEECKVPDCELCRLWLRMQPYAAAVGMS